MPGETSRARGGVWFFLALAFGISWGTFAIRRATTWPEPIDQEMLFPLLVLAVWATVAGVIAFAMPPHRTTPDR